MGTRGALVSAAGTPSPLPLASIGGGPSTPSGAPLASSSSRGGRGTCGSGRGAIRTRFIRRRRPLTAGHCGGVGRGRVSATPSPFIPPRARAGARGRRRGGACVGSRVSATTACTRACRVA